MKGRFFVADKGRAALVVDGRLEAIEIDPVGDRSVQPGAVYRATVTERIPSLGAAFLNLGNDLRGFLPDAGDAKAGDALIVQVRRAAEGEKAARLSRDLQIEHPLVISTPFNHGINISKKIADPDERDRLRAALSGLSGGYVIRTAAKGVTTDTLREIALSLALPDRLDPGLLRSGPDALTRLRLTYGDAPVESSFDHFDLESEIDALLRPRVDLSDGAWMVIEPTAALIAIDVNTGSARGGDALLRTNLAAAQEIPRQLRLRHLGGTVAVDFAGGPKGKVRRRIEAAMEQSVPTLGWGPAGLLELSLRKPGQSLRDLLQEKS